jgi:hypothetical protein
MSGSSARASSLASSSCGLAPSKIAPEIGGPFQQVLIASNLFVEGDSHEHLLQPWNPALEGVKTSAS